MSQTEVPDLLRLQTIPANLQQNVETDLLEVSTYQESTATTTGFARFDLQKKGWLHSHSKLFVGLVPPDAQVTTCIMPPTIGIGSVIQRAVLKIGNQVLNEISDWNHLQQIKSAQINNETQLAREQYTTGRCMATEFVFRKLDAIAVAAEQNTQKSPVEALKYGLSNGRDYGLGTAAAASVGENMEGVNLDPLPVSEMKGNAKAESPVYSVDLSDLFPFLKTHNLPLYMIDQQLSIELHWAPLRNQRVVVNDNAHLDYPIDRNELKFCADYVFYTDSDLMTRYAEANPRLEFSFPDYRLSKQSVSHTQLAEGIVANLGMANRLCSRVITSVERPKDAAQPGGFSDFAILGPYNSVCPDKTGAANQSTGEVEFNIRYNDRFEFPTSIKNKARLFSHYTQNEGLLYVTRDAYSRDGNGGYTEFNFMGSHVQSDATHGIPGRQWYLSTRLTNGRVGVRGIELHYKAQAMTDITAIGTYTLRSYVEYSRLALLENGLMSILNA